jgi:hypothetical protein
VERLDTGLLAISVLGVDEVEKRRLRLREDHLLTAGGLGPGDMEGQAASSGAEDLLASPKGTAITR